MALTKQGYTYRGYDIWRRYSSVYALKRTGRPSLRADGVGERVVKMNKYKMTRSELDSLIEALAYKYMATPSTERRYIYDWSALRRGVSFSKFFIDVSCDTGAPPTRNNICSHKERVKRKDTLYLWDDDDGNTKIGVTSEATYNDRILSCSKRRGTNPHNIKKVKTRLAEVYESRILSILKRKPYSEGDGHTEFRTISKSQRKRVERYLDLVNEGA